MTYPDDFVKEKIRNLFAYTIPGDWGVDADADSGIPVLRSTNFTNDGAIDYSSLVYRKINNAQLKPRLVTSGTILIEKSGGSPSQPVGRVVYCDKDFQGTASNFIEIAKAREGLSSKYVFYLLYHLYQVGLVLKYQQQTTGIINFKLDQYKEEQVRLPLSVAEQIQIATILSTIDQAIEQTEAIIAKQQRIKTGLMQDLLTRGIDENGNIRSEETHKFKDSPLGRIPVEWEVVPLQCLCDEIVDCPHSTPEYIDGGIPCIRTADMIPGRLLLEQAYRVSIETYQKRTIRLVPEARDIIYSREGERLGIASLVPEEHVCLGQRVMHLRPKKTVDSDYLVWVMNSPPFYRQATLNISSTTSPHINVGDVQRYKLCAPPSPEQKNLGKILAANEKILELEQAHVSKLKATKTGLMQDLLTGKVRVTNLLTWPMQTK